MAATVTARVEQLILSEDDIALARRKARDLGVAIGFNAFATAAITTAASELARNVWTHAGKGRVVLERILKDGRQGVRMEFRDEGPGIADLERALAGGFSTANSLGLGLSGAKRLCDEFTIDTAVGRGTTVCVVKWARY
jgi:serine/threonine-protein kinase RsbT